MDLKTTDSGFDLKIENQQQQRFRLQIPKLYAKINPEKSKTRIKPDRIKLVLFKKNRENWSKLKFDKEEEESKKEMQDMKGGNPQQSLMKMMKKMYDEGDDKTKRMIGEAFAKAQSGQKMA